MTTNRQIHLVSRPKGEATTANFKLLEAPVPALQDGQVLVRHHYMSLDPYMRGRMNDSKSYAQPQALDTTMIGGTVGVIAESRHPGYKAGDSVVGMGGWQEYSVVDGGAAGMLRKGRHDPRAAFGLSRRGRHAGRDGLVRADADLQAQGGRDGGGERGQRRRRQRGRPVGEDTRLPRSRHRRRPRQVRLLSSTNSASMPASTTSSTAMRSRSPAH